MSEEVLLKETFITRVEEKDDVQKGDTADEGGRRVVILCDQNRRNIGNVLTYRFHKFYSNLYRMKCFDEGHSERY